MQKFAEEYFKLLNEDFASINLTRINDFQDFNLKQIKDSVEPYYQSENFKKYIHKSGLHVDVGFGGGFPILPLAKILPNLKFVGIETRGKKAKVVGQIAEKLNLTNTSFIHSRIENVLIDIPVTMSFKAVGKVNDFLEKINCNQKIQIFFYKGPGFYELEKEQLGQAKENWNIVEEIEIELQGVEKRYLIGFEPKFVPRRTKNKTIKELVKLSDLL